jgi:hypothetical protein
VVCGKVVGGTVVGGGAGGVVVVVGGGVGANVDVGAATDGDTA